MKPPPIQWLPVFEAAARHLSFKKAAQQLNVTPSAVSQQIKQLERYLELDLFQRHGPSLSLTPAGEFYYPRATELLRCHLNGFEEFNRCFKQRVLRLDTPLFIAQEILVPGVMRFKDFAADAQIRITTSTDYIDFSSRTADAAIRFGHGNWPGLNARRLSPAQVGLVCAPDYAERSKLKPFSLEALLAHATLISVDENLADWRRFVSTEIEPKEVIVCDSYFSVVNAAQKGLGVAMGILPAINAWINRGSLCLLHEQLYPSQADYWLVYPESFSDLALIDAGFDWAQALFNELPELEA